MPARGGGCASMRMQQQHPAVLCACNPSPLRSEVTESRSQSRLTRVQTTAPSGTVRMQPLTEALHWRSPNIFKCELNSSRNWKGAT